MSPFPRGATPAATAPTAATAPEHGYTLQTLVVSSLLLLVAVGTSVLLYRAINSNADVHAQTERQEQAAPNQIEASSFTVTRISGQTDGSNTTEPSIRVQWSPPLYTGSPLLFGSAALLSYNARFECAAATPTEFGSAARTRQLPSPEIQISGDQLFPNNASDTGCLLRVFAYSCPEATPQTPCNEIGNSTNFPGATTQFEFAATKSPDAPTLSQLQLVDQSNQNALAEFRYLVSWTPPAYTGDIVGNQLRYNVRATRFDADDLMTPVEVCSQSTSEPFFVGSYIDTALFNFEITSERLPDGAQPAPVACSTEDLDAEVNQCLPDATPSTSALILCAIDFDDYLLATAQPFNFQVRPTADAPAEPRAAAAGNQADFELTWDAYPRATGYRLQWVRADGSKSPESMLLDEDEERAVLQLDNGASYNFTLSARTDTSESPPLRLCTTVFSNLANLPAPAIVAEARTFEDTDMPNMSMRQVYIQFLQPTQQEQHCPTPTYCSADNSCAPQEPESYRVRVFFPGADTTTPNGDVCVGNTDHNCPTGANMITNNDVIACFRADGVRGTRSAAGIFSPTALFSGVLLNLQMGNLAAVVTDRDYTIEVISSTLDCDETDTMNFADETGDTLYSLTGYTTFDSPPSP